MKKETIYYNAMIYTMDSEQDCLEAMRVENGMIQSIGTNEEILAQKSLHSTLVDLKGQYVYPGFHDSHMHVMEYGITKQQVDLSLATSVEDLVQTLKDAIKKREDGRMIHGGFEREWIVGGGFHQDDFTIPKIPTRIELDQVSMKEPVAIYRTCLHIAVLNTVALKLLGLDQKPCKVEGGSIDCDDAGKPNGILRENALDLLEQFQQPRDQQKLKDIAYDVMKELATYGITAVHSDDFASAGGFENAIQVYQELSNESRMPVRVTQQCRLNDIEDLNCFIQKGYVRKRLSPYYQLGPLKIIQDGSLGARTACLSNDYVDAPGVRGMELLPKEKLYEMISMAHNHNMPCAVHAIGDHTMNTVLDCYAKLYQNNSTQFEKLRHGIVHCQITDETILNRMSKLHVLAYVQPIFLNYDLHIVKQRVGEELAKTSYAFGTMMKKGLQVSGGCDMPVENCNVFHNMYCAISRCDLSGDKNTEYEKREALTRFQAMSLFTTNSAYAAGTQEWQGKLKPGYVADFIVTKEDIFAVTAEELRHMAVCMTVLNGETTYTI